MAQWVPVLAGVVFVAALILSGATWILDTFGKEGAEAKADHRFEHDGDVEIGAPTFLDFESLVYRHPIGGQWRRPWRWFSDGLEELVVFVAVVGYDDESDLAQIKDVFRWPLRMDQTKVQAGIHNWFEPNFDLKNLPAQSAGAFWLAFNGAVRPQEEKLIYCNFLAHAGSRRNGSVLWPMELTRKYHYMKVIVIEETGFARLRRFLRTVDAGEGDAVALSGVGQFVVAGLGAQLEKAYDKQLVDIEYHYETDSATTKIPLVHKRIWNRGGAPSVSLELRLETSDRWFRASAAPSDCLAAGAEPE